MVVNANRPEYSTDKDGPGTPALRIIEERKGETSCVISDRTRPTKTGIAIRFTIRMYPERMKGNQSHW